jgi:magnesium chelatase subunit D
MNEPDVGDLLACVALDPALGGLLFLDIDGRTLREYADVLAATMTPPAGTPPRVLQIDSATTEEHLWPHWGLATAGGSAFERTAGLLSETHERPPPILMIPDLARLGTGVLRAVLATVGADVVHVERHDVGESWQPTGRWLAACSAQDAATLSPHLLDRFPIRWARPRPAGLRARKIVETAVVARPEFRPETLDMLARAIPGPGHMRRCLALARTARALARLRDASAVSQADVDHAARLLGVDVGPLTGDDQDGRNPERVMTSVDLPELNVELLGVELPGEGMTVETAEQSIRAEAVAEGRTDLARDFLYPEDDPESVPKPYSLRWGAPTRSGIGQPTGTIVGDDPATSARDLAIVATLVRALRRAKRHGTVSRVNLIRDDLRQNRREQRSRRLLLLVLDHTSRRNWDCSPGLAEHLRWAYDHDAAVSVIELGHHGAVDPLRPERFHVRSVVDPRIMTIFDRLPGGATPLAAGIELAAQELHRSMRRGWAAVDAARLVVVTDGRGNVPLEASARGRVAGPVSRQGVDDAIAAAGAVAKLRRVESRVVTPDVQQYQILPQEIAQALGGTTTIVYDAADLP